MVNTKQSLFKIALKLGSIAIAVYVVSSLIFLSFNLYESVYRIRETIGDAIYMIALLSAIVIAVRFYKKLNDGFLKITQAIKIGLIVAIVMAVGVILYNYIFINLLNPDYYTNYYYGTTGEQAWLDYYNLDPDTHTKESYDVHVKEAVLREYQSYPILILTSIFMGLIISFIAGLLLKNEMKTDKK